MFCLNDRKQERVRVQKEQIRLKFFCDTADDIQSAMFRDILAQHGIPVEWREKEQSGGYLRAYMGYSAFGQSLYVRETDWQRAQEVLANFLEQPQADCQEAPEDADQNRTRRHARGAVLLWVMFVAVGAALLVTAWLS